MEILAMRFLYAGYERLEKAKFENQHDQTDNATLTI